MACDSNIFVSIPKATKKCKFSSEEELGGNVGSFMANHRLCSQGRNDHPGSNFCLEVEGKFVLLLPDVIQLPVLLLFFSSKYKQQTCDDCTDCCRSFVLAS